MPPPTPSGYGPIFDRANELLAGITAGYGSQECNPTIAQVPDGGPIRAPELSWVSDGIEPEWPAREECLVTGLASVREGFPGMPSARAITAGSGIVVDLAAWVFRLSELPEDQSVVGPDLWTASAQVIYCDLYIVLRSIMLGVDPNAQMAAGGAPIFSPQSVKASLPEVRSMGPSGGMVGFEVTLNVELT